MAVLDFDPNAQPYLMEDEGVVGYLTSTLRAGVWAVRNMMNHPKYKAVHGYGEIPVDMDAPMADQRYPYIHVMYRNNSFQPLGLDEAFDTVLEDGRRVTVYAYRYEGAFMVNVYATTILERERISDCVIAAIGMDRRFRMILSSNPFVSMQPNLATLASGTANESWGTPWDKDLMTAFRQFTFNVIGEFYMYMDPDEGDVKLLRRVTVDGQPFERIPVGPPFDGHYHDSGVFHHVPPEPDTLEKSLDGLLPGWAEDLGICTCDDDCRCDRPVDPASLDW